MTKILTPNYNKRYKPGISAEILSIAINFQHCRKKKYELTIPQVYEEEKD